MMQDRDPILVKSFGGAMDQSIDIYWRELKESPPGERFQRLHWRRRLSRKSKAKRACYLLAGLAVMVIGIILMPAPGPGTIIFLAGGALAAQESLRAARAMDWLEIHVRQWVAEGVRAWRRDRG